VRSKKKRLKKEGKPTTVPEDDKEMVFVCHEIYAYVLYIKMTLNFAGTQMAVLA